VANERSRWTRSAVVALMAAAALLPAAAGSEPTGATRHDGRRAAAPVEPRILVDLSVARPSGLAVADDGTLYLTEPGTGRVVRLTDSGTEVLLRLGSDQEPNGLALTDDGTLVVAATSGIVTLGPDGTRHDLPVPGAGEIAAVDVDTSGVVYASDRTAKQVVRVEPDGTASVVPFTGLGEVEGIDVDDAGTVSVLDATAHDVVQRTAAGVQSSVGVTGLVSPVGIDITDGRMLISDAGTGHLLERDADGTVRDLATDLPSPREVALPAGGAAYVAVDGTSGCRCPEAPGSVTRVPDGAAAGAIDLGDHSTIRSVAAAGAATALFTSTDGAPGYGPDNPLRRIVGDGPAEDVPFAGDPGAVDAAPDGTAYVVQFEGSTSSVLRRSPDGSTGPVDLPTEPGMDQVAGISVDEQGRLFVAMGSGYGSGRFRVVEPLAAGGPKVRYDSGGQSLTAMAAAGGLLHLAVSDGPGVSLLRVDLGTGTVTDRGPLDAPPYAFDADAAGTLYVIGDEPADAPDIHVIDPAGAVTALPYRGQRQPNELSIGTDGTLYVVDAEIGLLALDGIGPVTAPIPPTAGPAAPVPGAPALTG